MASQIVRFHERRVDHSEGEDRRHVVGGGLDRGAAMRVVSLPKIATNRLRNSKRRTTVKRTDAGSRQNWRWP
jgi:hypothetical protein